MKNWMTEIIKPLFPNAPEVGAKTKIYLGITRTGKNCVVAGQEDFARSCVILGYVVELGLAAGVYPKNAETVNVLVVVKLATGLDENRTGKATERIKRAHISCLVKL